MKVSVIAKTNYLFILPVVIGASKRCELKEDETKKILLYQEQIFFCTGNDSSARCFTDESIGSFEMDGKYLPIILVRLKFVCCSVQVEDQRVDPNLRGKYLFSGCWQLS